MATGDTLALWTAEAGIPPLATNATLVTRSGGSTPGEQFLLVAFDAAADEHYDFRGILPQVYDGGGFTLRLWWGAATATTGNVVWDASFRAMEDDAEDIDASHTYAYNSVTDAAPSASGEFTAAVVTFTDGADADNTGAGDAFILRIRRDANNGSDTMAGDAQLLALELRET